MTEVQDCDVDWGIEIRCQAKLADHSPDGRFRLSKRFSWREVEDFSGGIEDFILMVKARMNEEIKTEMNAHNAMLAAREKNPQGGT